MSSDKDELGPGSEPSIDLSVASQIDRICDEFEQAQKANSQPLLIDYLKRLDTPLLEARLRLGRELLLLDIERRKGQGEIPSAQDYTLPADFEGVLRDVFAKPEAHTPDDVDDSATLAPLKESSSDEEDEIATLHPTADDRSIREPSIGDRVQYFGDYELIEEIARGGMGVVYKAKQISLSRIIALKMILSGQLAGDDEVQRFQLEAESAANLDHPGIVPIYDIGEHQGQHYFTMKMIDGQTLTELSPRLRNDYGRIVELVAKIADAIHHAHQRGILHRDLKPGNVLVEADDQPLVTDFGLARKMEANQELTQTGAVIGTPGFMSPEQAAGKGVTTATDIYSLGAILYELLCGQPPHAKESVLDTLMSVISDPPKRLREYEAEVPADLELIVLKCLEKAPEKRYTSAAEIANDLRAFAKGEPLLVRAPTAYELAKNWLGKNVGNVVWVPIIAVAIGLVSGFSFWAITLGGWPENVQGAFDILNPERKPWLLAFGGESQRGWFAILLVLSCTLPGFLTARLVRTKNRFSDMASGLSVGLLAGLISLVAGIGPVLTIMHMTGNGPQTLGEDIELLSLIAKTRNIEGNVLRDYPATEHVTSQELADALLKKINVSLRYNSLTGMWIATAVALGIFSVLGVVQTVVAGSLLRSQSFRLAALNYGYFAFALVMATVLVWIDLSTFILSGDHYYIRWLLPLLCLLSALFVLFAVVRLWNPGITTLGTVALVFTSVAFFNLQFFVFPPPVVMKFRVSIANELRHIRRDPQNIQPRQEIIFERTKFASFLDAIGWHDEAYEQFQIVFADLDTLDGMSPKRIDDFIQYRRRDVFMMAANNCFSMNKEQEGLGYLDRLDEQFGIDKHTLQIRLQHLPDKQNTDLIDDKLRQIQFHVEDTGAEAEEKGLAIQWTAEAMRRMQGSTLEEMQDYRQELIDTVLPSLETSQDSELAERRERQRDWMLGTQTWRLAGPFDLPNPTSMESLTMVLPPEESLLEDITQVQPDDVIKTEIGYPVFFHTEEEGDSDLGWHRENAAALAWTTFKTERERNVSIRLRSDDGMMVWIDGNLLLKSPQPRSLYQATTSGNLKLAEGDHILIVKVSQATRDWGFSVDLFDEDGFPLPVWDNNAMDAED